MSKDRAAPKMEIGDWQFDRMRTGGALTYKATFSQLVVM